MRVLVIFFIFLFSICNVNAKEKFTEKCDGYCEGENLKFEARQYPSKFENAFGKKSKKPLWTIARAVRKPNSTCMIFDSFIERAVPIKVKKKDKEKYMKDFRSGNDIISANYSINSCRPCPAGVKASKHDKTGYCTIEMIKLDVMYKNGFDKKYFPPDMIDMSVVSFERDETFDILTDLPNANNQVVMEIFNFSLSLKKDVEIVRIKEKGTGNFYYFYSFFTYKTASKQQIKKVSERQFIQDQNLIDFLNDYMKTDNTFGHTRVRTRDRLNLLDGRTPKCAVPRTSGRWY